MAIILILKTFLSKTWWNVIGHVSIRISSCGGTVGRNTPAHDVCLVVQCIACNVHPDTRNALEYGRSSVERPRTVPDGQYLTFTVRTDNYGTDNIWSRKHKVWEYTIQLRNIYAVRVSAPKPQTYRSNAHETVDKAVKVAFGSSIGSSIVLKHISAPDVHCRRPTHAKSFNTVRNVRCMHDRSIQWSNFAIRRCIRVHSQNFPSPRQLWKHLIKILIDWWIVVLDAFHFQPFIVWSHMLYMCPAAHHTSNTGKP